ncbi:hypothetical protein [Endothiovibrio diazotrophicus]
MKRILAGLAVGLLSLWSFKASAGCGTSYEPMYGSGSGFYYFYGQACVNGSAVTLEGQQGYRSFWTTSGFWANGTLDYSLQTQGDHFYLVYNNGPITFYSADYQNRYDVTFRNMTVELSNGEIVSLGGGIELSGQYFAAEPWFFAFLY